MGASIFGSIIYLCIKISYHAKMIKDIHKVLQSFPTPEQLAKEILKIKLPITDLPPEMIEQVNAFNNQIQATKGVPNIAKEKYPSYVG